MSDLNVDSLRGMSNFIDALIQNIEEALAEEIISSDDFHYRDPSSPRIGNKEVPSDIKIEDSLPTRLVCDAE